MPYYVYAYDIKGKCITVALPFTDKKTAKHVRLTALHEMKEKHGTDGFYFRCTNVCLERSEIDLPPELEDLLPRQQVKVKSDLFDINDFEEAAQFTEKSILTKNLLLNSPRDIRFIHYVRSVFEKKKMSESPSEGKIPDFDNEGGFVTLQVFSQRTNYSKKTLQDYCAKKHNVQWLNEEHTLGKNKLGHFFKRDGDKRKFRNLFFVPNDATKYPLAMKGQRR